MPRMGARSRSWYRARGCRCGLGDSWVEFWWQGRPTLTRPCAVKTPRPGTPGVDVASKYALTAWERDLHRKPPLHYEKEVEFTGPGGHRRRKTIDEEDKALHFSEDSYTHSCWSAKERKLEPSKWLDVRGSLLGNCFSPAVVAVSFADLLWQVGLVCELADVDEIVLNEARLLPADPRAAQPKKAELQARHSSAIVPAARAVQAGATPRIGAGAPRAASKLCKRRTFGSEVRVGSGEGDVDKSAPRAQPGRVPYICKGAAQAR